MTKARSWPNNQRHYRDAAADALAIIHCKLGREMERIKRGEYTQAGLVFVLMDLDREALAGLLALQAAGAEVDIS